MMKEGFHFFLKTDHFIWYNKTNTFHGTKFILFSPKEFEGFPLKNAIFKMLLIFFIPVSMHENRKFLVLTSIAHNIPLIKCYRHKKFKDFMYRSPNMRKIKFENAHFCKEGYLFPSEHSGAQMSTNEH